VFAPLDDALGWQLERGAFDNRVATLSDEMWRHVSTLNDAIHSASVDYFRELHARFVPLPLTTRMISSPGAVYGREAISYTTDTNPVKLSWFDNDSAFLAESSQIYLELSLLVPEQDHVFCIYSSFRKEPADATHLPEFRHIEYEGHVDLARNKEIALGLLFRIVDAVLAHPDEPLAYFLDDPRLDELATLRDRVYDVSLAEALEALHESTGDVRFREFTLKHIGSWEEIRITEIYGGLVVVNHFPLLEVPFYHAISEATGPNGEPVAENADVIWPSYREVIGMGQRIASVAELEEKAEIFDLPREDYAPYLQSRRLPGFGPSSGFGLGWERLLQGLISAPFIHSALLFPRTHLDLKP
jgi:aspartyl/asparaginyl-tRNA synthetase